MLKETARSDDLPRTAAALIRATSLRGLPVWSGRHVLGSVLGLTYDHAARHVTGLLLARGDQNGVQTILLDELNLLAAPYRQVQARTVRPWPAHGQRKPPVDTLTLHASPGRGIAYVHDAWFDPVTGAIDAYEVGLLPRQAASAPTLRVPAELVSFAGANAQANQGTVPSHILGTLGGAFRTGVRLPLASSQAGSAGA